MTTVIDLFQHVSKCLQSCGINDYDSEAFIVVSHFLGMDTRAEIFLNGSQPVSAQIVSQVNTCLDKRKSKIPLAYITGQQEFWSKTFLVTPDVLIPRFETELLVEKILSAILQTEEDTYRIIDFGTGSGIISIVLALEIESAIIFGVDKSFRAINIAKQNAITHGVDNRIQFINSDWSKGIINNNSFDIVVSNPPYVSRAMLPELQPELTYEPQLALDGGPNGTDEIDYLLQSSSSILKKGGWLFMEIGYDQKEYITNATNQLSCFSDINVHDDYAGLPRIFQARFTG